MSDQITYRIGAIFNAKGNLAAKAGGMTKAIGDLGSRLAAVGSKVSAFGDRMLESSTRAAMGWAKVGAALGSGVLLAGAAAIAKAGLEGNAGQERMRNTVAGTLQLFNHSAGAADQLGTNIKVAGAAMAKLSDIADASPGEMKDVQQMFTNMLPGARSVTGEMQRIMDLTASAAVFTPTFGGDFGLVGAQMSRILTGGAGAEMETWKTLQVPILRAGQAMDLYGKKGKKVFGENQAEGEKLTQAFNKLGKEDRLRLVEAAMKGGADDLAKMYASSWEGASSSAISAGRKVAVAFTAPIFGEVKKALVRAGEQPNSLLGKNRIGKLQAQAGAIGVLMARPVARMLDKLERGIRYFQDNFNAVFNRMYQVFQVGAGLLRAAFAFGLAKMMAGAAISAGAGAVRGARGLASGAGAIAGSFNARRKGMRDSKTADAMSFFINRVAKGNPLLLVAGQGMMSMGIGLMAMIPMLLIAAAALAAFSVVFVVIAGVAAYIASKWEELSASVVKGFQDGSITLRPLIIAALVLWEKLKRLGEVFFGATTGAGMMQTAINAATSVINGLAEGVIILTQVAAGFISIIAQAYKFMNPTESITGGDMARIGEVLQSGLTSDGATAAKIVERRKKEGVYDSGPLALNFGERADAMAAKMNDAANSWRSIDLKDINPGEIDDWTKKADAMAKGLFEGDSKDDPKKKAKGVSIGTAIIQVDLRNTDPDRMMVGLIEPIRKATKQPDSSSFDMGGF